MLIGVTQSSRSFLSGGSPSSDISNVVIDQTTDQIEITFDINISEVNKPPSLDQVEVTGTVTKTETLTATPSGFYSESGWPEGSHTYQWYRANNKQSVGSSIGGATSSTYVLGAADVSKYIRCEVTPVQVGGTNTTGEAVTSLYTGQVQDNVFNPFTDIAWFTAHQPSGASDLAGVGWLNEGTGNNSVQNGSDPIPTYVPGVGVDFELSSNQELVLDLPSPQYSMPVEIWLRVSFESFNAGFSYPIAFNSAQRIEQRASGAIYLSGASCSFSAVIGDFVVMRFVISGGASTSKFNKNNGTEITNVNASTTAFGTSNGRLGANSGGTGNRFDGIISHVFIKSGETSPTEEANMWTWFSTNAPWD